jgi:hypothetical protein
MSEPISTLEPAAAVAIDDAGEAAESRRYYAVVQEVPGVDVFTEEHAPEAPPAARRSTDRYTTDIPVLVIAALLAGSTFLPWYKSQPGFGLTVTGWQSGTWGPIVFFLAVGSVVLVALRRLGVHVSLPVEESLIHEGTGWIALIGGVIKRWMQPGPSGLLDASYGVWVAIVAALLLVVVAGRMSPQAPLVRRPGWQKGTAGLVGMIVLGVVVAGSAVFATINEASLQATNPRGDLFAGTVRGRMPDCAKDFPLPEGVKPQYGFGTGATCQAQLTSAASPAEVTAAFKKLLTSKKWTYAEVKGAPGSTILTITKPRCATLAVVPDPEAGAIAAVAFTPCASPSPTG